MLNDIAIIVPLSSPLRFFFSDTVTSVFIMEVSLLRSLELSTMAEDDTTGADNGRDTALVVVKSKTNHNKFSFSIFDS